MKKVFAELRPSQRARLKHFQYVFQAEGAEELNAIAQYVLDYDPDNGRKHLKDRRFHIQKSRVFVRDEEAASIMVLVFEKPAQPNPNMKVEVE